MGSAGVRKKVRAFLRLLESRGDRPRTIEGYRKTLARFRRSGFSVKRFLRLELSPGPAYRAVQVLHVRGFLKFAGRTAEAALLPRLRPPPTPPPIPAPSRDQVERFLASIPLGTPYGIRNRAMAELAYSSGLRACELSRLKVNELDLAGHVVRVVMGKGGRERIVPFGPAAEAWLRRYMAQARHRIAPKGSQDDGTFFVSGGTGQALGPVRIWEVFHDAQLVSASDGGSDGAGFKARNITPHALRRAAASHCQAAGMNIREVQELLGHASLQTTVRYTALGREELRGTIEGRHPRNRMTVAAPLGDVFGAEAPRPGR